jgi:hypothetical protein
MESISKSFQHMKIYIKVERKWKGRFGGHDGSLFWDTIMFNSD